MSDKTMTARVKGVLGREWSIDAASIPDGAALNSFARWDSLGHITIVLALSTEFGFELSADTVQELRSLPRIVAYLHEHATAEGKGAGDERRCAPSA